MLLSVIVAALLTAPHISSQALNGTWAGHLGIERKNTTCAPAVCRMPRDFTIVIDEGSFILEGDPQLLDEASGDNFLLQTHVWKAKDNYHTDDITTYAFGLAVNNQLLYGITQVQLAVGANDVLLGQGCTCSYLAVARKR